MFLFRPEERPKAPKGYKGKYYCKHQGNLEYFRALHKIFEARDTSYIRRVRLFQVLRMISFLTEKNLRECDRDDINEMVAYSNSVQKSPKSKRDFIKNTKFLWKLLLPEKDERGRIDETIFPYPVRHLSGKIEKSREKLRNDRLTIEEFENLIKAFSQDVRLQAFITVEMESLSRPQELLYARIKDVEAHDNYAKIWITEHGKEGPGFLQCIDSYPYLMAWLNQHPLRHDPNAFLFLNLGDAGKYKQLKPGTINKHLREKCKLLGINKRITCYSLKRNGVTFRRLRGDSDATIQHVARWTSTKQLKCYDLSQPDDTFRIELVKRGLLKDERFREFQPTSQKCLFCGKINGIAEDICALCKRPLDRQIIREEVEEREGQLVSERREKAELRKEFDQIRGQLNRINSFMNQLVDKNPEVLEVLAMKAKKNGLEKMK